MTKHRHRGFTLLETLVTLVLVAMAAGLIAEGLYQVALVERRLQGTQLPDQIEALHRVWLQQSLEGLLPGPKDGSDKFEGSPRELKGLSTLLPAHTSSGPQALRIGLSFNRESGQTELQIAYALPGMTETKSVLARWQGDSGAWLYQDSHGEWQRQWPPLAGMVAGRAGSMDALPSLIALDRGGELGWLVVARPLASSQALGQRIDLEKLP
jgi:prepilin-type N-terminal cleavage/methylation domain-containing protein